MRVVVTGATGNVGTSVLSVLADDPSIDTVVGIARRRPTDWHPPKVTWTAADIAVDDLDPIFDGADAVVHLAWLIQPSRDLRALWATNVVGTRRVADAVARTGVPTLIAASSTGAYSPAPPGQIVDEAWPTDGVPESSYSWQKAILERTLDVLATTHPHCRVVRIRPALIFKRQAGHEIRRLFVGHLVPRRLLPVDALTRALQRSPVPFQCVHTDDVADAVRRCLHADVDGAFNLAAAGVLGGDGAHRATIARLAKPVVGVAWRARLIPIDPGWLTLAASVPMLSTERAATELGWTPTMDAAATLHELLDGLRDDASSATPPLESPQATRDAAHEPAL